MEPSATLLDRVLGALRARQPEALRLGVQFVGVVGSVARGEAGPTSDVDVVFEVVGPLDYWKLGGLSTSLEDDLGRRIDLVDRQMMVPERWTWMARDMVTV